MSKRDYLKGFSIVELAMVLVVVGVIFVIAAAGYNAFIGTKDSLERKAVLEKIIQSVVQHVSQTKALPSSLPQDKFRGEPINHATSLASLNNICNSYGKGFDISYLDSSLQESKRTTNIAYAVYIGDLGSGYGYDDNTQTLTVPDSKTVEHVTVADLTLQANCQTAGYGGSSGSLLIKSSRMPVAMLDSNYSFSPIATGGAPFDEITGNYEWCVEVDQSGFVDILDKDSSNGNLPVLEKGDCLKIANDSKWVRTSSPRINASIDDLGTSSSRVTFHVRDEDGLQAMRTLGFTVSELGTVFSHAEDSPDRYLIPRTVSNTAVVDKASPISSTTSSIAMPVYVRGVDAQMLNTGYKSLEDMPSSEISTPYRPYDEPKVIMDSSVPNEFGGSINAENTGSSGSSVIFYVPDPYYGSSSDFYKHRVIDQGRNAVCVWFKDPLDLYQARFVFTAKVGGMNISRGNFSGAAVTLASNKFYQHYEDVKGQVRRFCGDAGSGIGYAQKAAANPPGNGTNENMSPATLEALRGDWGLTRADALAGNYYVQNDFFTGLGALGRGLYTEPIRNITGWGFSITSPGIRRYKNRMEAYHDHFRLNEHMNYWEGYGPHFWEMVGNTIVGGSITFEFDTMFHKSAGDPRTYFSDRRTTFPNQSESNVRADNIGDGPNSVADLFNFNYDRYDRMRGHHIAIMPNSWSFHAMSGIYGPYTRSRPGNSASYNWRMQDHNSISLSAYREGYHRYLLIRDYLGSGTGYKNYDHMEYPRWDNITKTSMIDWEKRDGVSYYRDAKYNVRYDIGNFAHSSAIVAGYGGVIDRRSGHPNLGSSPCSEMSNFRGCATDGDYWLWWDNEADPAGDGNDGERYAAVFSGGLFHSENDETSRPYAKYYERIGWLEEPSRVRLEIDTGCDRVCGVCGTNFPTSEFTSTSSSSQEYALAKVYYGTRQHSMAKGNQIDRYNAKTFNKLYGIDYYPSADPDEQYRYISLDYVLYGDGRGNGGFDVYLDGNGRYTSNPWGENPQSPNDTTSRTYWKPHDYNIAKDQKTLPSVIASSGQRGLNSESRFLMSLINSHFSYNFNSLVLPTSRVASPSDVKNMGPIAYRCLPFDRDLRTSNMMISFGGAQYANNADSFNIPGRPQKTGLPSANSNEVPSLKFRYSTFGFSEIVFEARKYDDMRVGDEMRSPGDPRSIKWGGERTDGTHTGWQ